MERILEYTVSLEEAGVTIKDFLRQKGYSRQNIVELKKQERSILVNGVWEYVTYRLQLGDLLQICMKEKASEKIAPVNLPFPIRYEDEDLMVIDKPADMPIHPSLNNYDNTLANAAAFYFNQKGIPFRFRCINRLDRDTTGLTVLAKNMVSCSILQQQMLKREIKREYLAIADGYIDEDSGIITAPIGRRDGSTIERMIDYENGERAITHFKVLERMADATLLSLILETGRTHQIRVHVASIGHPLLGDFLYNPKDQRMNRQALHAWHLSLKHPITGERMEWEADIPSDMKAVLASRGCHR